MVGNTDRIAEQLNVYYRLGMWGRWELRHFLRWICDDPASQAVLLEYEHSVMRKRPFMVAQNRRSLKNALSWYNAEDHQPNLPDRLPRERLPDMLRIVTIFLKTSPQLDPSYRGLILAILRAGETFAASTGANPSFTPAMFCREAATLITGMNHRWDEAFPGHSERAERLLAGFTRLVRHTGDLNAVNDVLRKISTTINQRTALTLIERYEDLETLRSHFRRIVTHHTWSGVSYDVLLGAFQDAVEGEQLLAFMETLAHDPLLAKYRQYDQTEPTVRSFLANIIAGSINRKAWQQPADPRFVMEQVITEYETEITRRDLQKLWHSSYATRDGNHIRWAFDRFADSIPVVQTDQDWSIDNHWSRRYWNWGVAETQERDRFFTLLQPHIRAALRSLTSEEINTLYTLLPGYLTIETFTSTVNIPTNWATRLEKHESYDKWTGFHDETTEVAYPTAFRPHTFSFERPNIQPALDLFENPDHLHALLHSASQATPNTEDTTLNLPADLADSLTAIVAYLRRTFGSSIERIGLYGSWQHGDATPESDVDLVVVLNHEVAWFDANGPSQGQQAGQARQSDQLHWHQIEEAVNMHSLDRRIYSIKVVTPAMLSYYAEHGPLQLQNWVHAIRNCSVLWERDR
jgi:hypothetical protein